MGAWGWGVQIVPLSRTIWGIDVRPGVIDRSPRALDVACRSSSPLPQAPAVCRMERKTDNPYSSPRSVGHRGTSGSPPALNRFTTVIIAIDLFLSAVQAVVGVLITIESLSADAWGWLASGGLIISSGIALIADALILARHRMGVRLGWIAGSLSIMVAALVFAVLIIRYGQNTNPETINRAVIQAIGRVAWNGIYLAALFVQSARRRQELECQPK